MRNIFVIICSLFFVMVYSQEQKYTFYVELSHYSDAPIFKEDNGRLIYNGKDSKEAEFFAKYTILEFRQSFPASKKSKTLNYYTVSSYSRELISTLVAAFPVKYLMTEDITNFKYELADSFPSDYGNTSPLTNLGLDASLSNFDYVGVPKAWDYTSGLNKIIIGISDGGAIFDQDLDFISKTSYVNQDLDPTDDDISHATTVTAIAAAQGNNGYGTTGICQNCNIIETDFKSNSYNNLLELANNGAKVINMSWYGHGYTPIHQSIIDELYEAGVVLVACSGNVTTASGSLKYYPASHNHVISVLTVNHKNNLGEQVEMGPLGETSKFVKDMIAPTIVTNYQGNGPYTDYNNNAFTSNDAVDICAPGYRLFRYGASLQTGNIEYQEWGGTSGAAPHITGTVGLMLSLYECMEVDEVEDVLQLTSKNLEKIQGNEPFIGRSGSGKLETGDAVEFVYEMKQSNGNAIIDGQDFYRFDFNLKHINNKLTISNQRFRDSCTADFAAKQIIEILPGSDFNPDNTGFVDLKIDSTIDVTCVAKSGNRVAVKNNNTEMVDSSATKLYPNPNNGTFDITLAKEIKGNTNIEIYDLSGKVIYRDSKQGTTLNINVPNLSSGMYIVRLSSGDYNETVKFVKN